MVGFFPSPSDANQSPGTSVRHLGGNPIIFFPGAKPNVNDIYENIQTSLFEDERKDGLLRFIDGQLFFYPLEGDEKERASRIDRHLANIPLVNLYKIEEEGKPSILVETDPLLPYKLD